MHRLYILTICLVFLCAGPVFAQPEPGQANTAQQQEPLPPEITRDFDRVETIQREIEGLETDRRATSGQERALIVEEIETKNEELGRAISELVEEITRDNTSYPEGVTARANALLAREEKRIDSALEEVEKDISNLRDADAAADKDPEDALVRFNQRFAALLEQKHENILLRQRMGATVERDLAKFDEELKTRARRLAAVIEVARDRGLEIADRPASTDDEKKAKKAEIEAVDQRLERAAASMQSLIDLMKARDIEASTYQRLLIQATGQVTTDVFNREVSLGLAASALGKAQEWVAERAPQAVFALVLFILIMLLSWALSRLTRRLVRRSVEKTEMSVLARDFVVRSSGRLVIVIGLLTGLSQLGIELGPVLAGLGIAGFVVGFALQDTLSNFASGLMILVYRPFDVGDLIEVSGVRGTVDEMTLVTTSVLTLDNQLLIIPNNKVWSNVIRNVTAQSRRRVDFLFGISYDDDIDKVSEVLRDIAKNTKDVEADGEITVEVHEFGDSSVNIVVRVWTQTDRYWQVFWAINAEVKRRFDAEGISIPFPQRDVHMHDAA